MPDIDPVLPRPDASVTTGSPPPVASPQPAEAAVPGAVSPARPAPAASPALPQAPQGEPAAPAELPGEIGPLALPAGAARPETPAEEPLPGRTNLPPPPPLTAEELAMLAPRRLEPDPPRPADPSVLPGAASSLPQIGTVSPAEIDEALPPARAFARPFDNPEARPVLAILLRDTGGPGVDREALAALPFPVSFVIDPLAPDAATAAAIYRAAGQEVLMLATGIPEGATAADLEVTFAAHAAALPEAVALVDLAEAGFQADRRLATEVATVVAGQGRGLVTYDRGLNAADQAARRQGLPTLALFRRLEEAGGEAPAIRQALDRAAFRAAQEGRAAVIGETREETVRALLAWSVEGRAATVALAPATAAMR
ncbi:divergent polysaccharide deacetylase family protein [Cereibacter changlensis]|uniref:divergent polysaccharide deacetylase family protein n=1 Tax=Cereibacter changlensis TaxID=402884 RepID=UPI001FE68D73|nr:divergent polysaccharide deacetylase family protein [Cereibacter changlensis]